MSLRSRLLVALIPLFVLCLAAADAGAYTALRSTLLSGIDSQIGGSRATIERALENGTSGPEPRPGGSGAAFPQETYGALYDSKGHLLSSHTFLFGATASSMHPEVPSPLPLNQYVDVAGTGGVASYRLWSGPAVDGTSNVLLVAVPLDGVNATLTTLLLFELAISAGITLLLATITWFLVRRGLRPLERMAATAQSIAASQLNRRVESNDRTEVGRLGGAINTMLTQLESAFAERERNELRLRQFIADASHELRTPMTSMRGYAELLQREPSMEQADTLLAMRRLEEETKRMSVLVDDLLLLARLDQGRPLERGDVDLTRLVQDACTDARASAPQRVISADAAVDVHVVGDDMRLRQVLSNLLRNALVHTPERTPVEVRLRQSAAAASIEVADHGPGIPAAQRSRIFERFHRADSEVSGDRGGSGLGLSIVAAIITAHMGSVDVTDTPGGGATFVVTLPRSTS
jgi:two-component system OmpR family sensor kinase